MCVGIDDNVHSNKLAQLVDWGEGTDTQLLCNFNKITWDTFSDVASTQSPSSQSANYHSCCLMQSGAVSYAFHGSLTGEKFQMLAI